MGDIKQAPIFDTMRSLGGLSGGVDLGKLIAKDNFPTEVAEIWWSVATKVLAFGNLTQAEIANVWAKLDNFRMGEFAWMTEDDLAEYDETYWDQVELVMQPIVSLARDGTLLKTSMSEESDNKPGMMDKIGRFGGQGDSNEPSMINKMDRWRQ